MLDAIVNLKNVCFSWDNSGRKLLNLPEFVVERHEHVFLKGPSGSGKSTLLALVGGILVAESGKLEILGKEIKHLSSSARDSFRVNHIGFIFQLFNLLPYLSIEENVMLPLKFSKIRAERAGETKVEKYLEAQRLLKALELDEPLANRSPVTELSVGQQQRVAVARALIGSPELVIADEPTSALDSDLRHSFLKLLFNECKKADTTLLFVSHDSNLGSLFKKEYSMNEINKNNN